MEFANIFKLLEISLITCSISSMWLYSEILSELRTYMQKQFHNSKLFYLTVCQLCCSFWITIGVMIIYPLNFSFLQYFTYPFISSLISWGIGSSIIKDINIGAYYENKIFPKE